MMLGIFGLVDDQLEQYYHDAGNIQTFRGKNREGGQGGCQVSDKYQIFSDPLMSNERPIPAVLLTIVHSRLLLFVFFKDSFFTLVKQLFFCRQQLSHAPVSSNEVHEYNLRGDKRGIWLVIQ